MLAKVKIELGKDIILSHILALC